MQIRDPFVHSNSQRTGFGRWAVHAFGLAAALLVCAAPTLSQVQHQMTAKDAGSAVTGQGPEKHHREAQRRMLKTQLIARGIEDPRVLAAMGKVPRHEFVGERLRDQAYADRPLPIGEGQTISQPYIVALMTQLAQLDEKSRVLEIGTGSGYQAAILHEVAGEVYSIEIIEALAQNAREKLQRLGFGRVHLRHGDGYQGWPEAAPFDAILVTAAPPRVPEPLKEQLAVGGRLIVPVGTGVQQLVVYTRTSEGIERESIISVIFVPMTGEAQKLQK